MFDQLSHRWMMFAFVIAIVAIFAAPVQAGGGSRVSADQFMNDFGSQAVRLLADQKRSAVERTSAMRQLLTENFDLNYIRRFVLSRHWRRASNDERAEFRQLLEDYLVVIYGRRLGNYSGEKFVIGDARAVNKAITVVHSHIERPKAPPVKVNWRLRQAEGEWSIVDVIVEGVSMSMEFSSVIRGSGGKVAGLIAKLRQLTAGIRPAKAKKVAAKAI